MLSKFLNKNNKIKLQFPLNNGGQEIGISEGGIEHFTGKLVESLCKEILQNSLDARIDKNQVKVEFKLLSIPRKEIPQIDELVKTVERCLEYWKQNEKAEKILKKSLISLKQDNISILRVSDYGTCGLTGASEKRNTNFANLVKSSGASSKGGQSGGSFGIGKFAPFACSFPRTVFYSTLTTENEYAFQGVSRLVTHEVNGEATQGVGYIGNPNQNMPILNEALIPDTFTRKEIGTDINIIGFNGGENWEESIIKASLMSFFESIYEGKLEVVVGNETINQTNFKQMGEKHLKIGQDKDYTYEYFKCITAKVSDNKKIFKEDFIYNNENYGEIELHLLKERNLSKRIAYLRSTGMKIIDKDRFRTAMQFSGVLKFNGEKINGFIRSLETPSHDKLETDRYDNPKQAKKIIDALNKLIRLKVTEFGKLSEGKEIDIKGLSKFLPDYSKEGEILNFSLKNGAIKNITLEKYEKKTNKKSDEDLNGVIEKVALNDIEEGQKDTPTDEPNDYVSLPGEDPKPREPKDPIEGEGESKPKEIEVIKEKGKAHLKLSKRKALINDQFGKRYKVLLESLEDREVYIRLKAKYEDGGSEVVQLEKLLQNGVENTSVISDKIFEVKLTANKKEVLYLTLREEIYASMEVIVNAK